VGASAELACESAHPGGVIGLFDHLSQEGEIRFAAIAHEDRGPLKFERHLPLPASFAAVDVCVNVDRHVNELPRIGVHWAVPAAVSLVYPHAHKYRFHLNVALTRTHLQSTFIVLDNDHRIA
jgi:hypothetical protein